MTFFILFRYLLIINIRSGTPVYPNIILSVFIIQIYLPEALASGCIGRYVECKGIPTGFHPSRIGKMKTIVMTHNGICDKIYILGYHS